MASSRTSRACVAVSRSCCSCSACLVLVRSAAAQSRVGARPAPSSSRCARIHSIRPRTRAPRCSTDLAAGGAPRAVPVVKDKLPVTPTLPDACIDPGSHAIPPGNSDASKHDGQPVHPPHAPAARAPRPRP